MQFRKRVNLGLVEGPLNYRSKLWKSLSASLFQPINGLSVYQDSTRTTLASVGDAVGALNSLTNSDVTTQATTSFKPQLLQSGAGNNYLSFDGVNDSLPVPIPNGAWVADMLNVNYLTNSNTATTNTIVDYLGNTVILKAGEIGFNGARRVENLVTTKTLSVVGNPVVTENQSDSRGGFTASKVEFTTANLSNRVQVYAGNQTISTTMVITAMGLVGGETITVINGWSAIFNITLTQNWRRYSFTYAGNLGPIGNSSFIMIYAQTANATIYVSDLQVSPTDYAPEYIDIATVYNAGIAGVKYFDTLPANTVTSNVVTEVTGAKLPTPPTIKVNAGDSLAISPKYTARTIVDYLGNTVTLKAGEIGWNNARRVENLMPNSDDLTLNVNSNTGNTTIKNQINLSPNGVRGKLATLTVNAGDIYRVVVDCASTSSFSIELKRSSATTLEREVRSFTGAQSRSLFTITRQFIYAHTALEVTFNSSNNVVIDVYGIALFKVSSAGEPVESYLASTVTYNAGIAGVKYFDTYNANTVASNIVTEATGAKLPGPITPNTTGVFTALAYSPSTPAQSDRDKIDVYVQNQGVKL